MQLLWLVSLDVSLGNEVILILVFGSTLPGNTICHSVTYRDFAQCNVSAELYSLSSPFWTLKYGCLIRIRVSLISSIKKPGKV